MILIIYGIIALIAWPFCSRTLISDVVGTRYPVSSRRVTNFDLGMGIFLGGCFATIWPAGLIVAFCLWDSKPTIRWPKFMRLIFAPKSLEFKDD